jgi:REP element-mobilizing transposase RayT
MPYTKVLIHYIWSTKNREHTISKELKPLLLKHIKDNSLKKEIFIDTLNCVSDHNTMSLLLLISLKPVWLKPINQLNNLPTG